jgi:iron complex transport system substrate-binding protein
MGDRVGSIVCGPIVALAILTARPVAIAQDDAAREGAPNDPAIAIIFRMFPPERIVCLTEETVETLYLLGEECRIVGVSGYAVRPARVRREKPRVSAFISADFEKILALEPDLVLTFSDLQADIAAELIRRNIAVHAFNQRDVAGILAMIRTLGALVGALPKAEALVAALQERLTEARARASLLARRPRVYFEEWDEPMISGIRWVAELVEIAGGSEVFPELSRRKNARDRVVSPNDVIAAAPDIIVGSWCGKKFVPAKVAARPGFAGIPAVRSEFLREIKSSLILQPGPAALTDGLDALADIVMEWSNMPERCTG